MPAIPACSYGKENNGVKETTGMHVKARSTLKIETGYLISIGYD